MTMPIQMKNDHEDLRSLAEDILHSAAGPDVGGRDNQFELFALQLRRHLAVIEEALLPLAGNEDHPEHQTNAIDESHRQIRKKLKQLDRRDKDSPGWSGEFRALMRDVETVSQEHERLITHGRERHAPDYGDFAHRYERAKIKRMQGMFNWNRFPEIPGGRTGAVAATAAGAAAIAGAAYAASRWFRSGRRAKDRDEEDFELRLETDENMRLISSRKVEGTAVYGNDGEKLGMIDNFMVDKYTGRVGYAVMRFGGHFGFGENLFPLPWAVLDYDEEMDGYVLDISKEELSSAPRFEASDQPEWTPSYRRRILIFYSLAGLPGRSGGSDEGSETERQDSRSGILEGGTSATGMSGGGASNVSPASEPRQSEARQNEPSQI